MAARGAARIAGCVRLVADTGAFDAEAFEAQLRGSALAGGVEPSHLTAVLGAGGKRVRPRLVHLFGALCGGERAAIEELALAVEMLHAATLVHDDIIDGAASRRGAPALHHTAGTEVAMLVGDLYIARCGLHLAAAGSPPAAAEVFRAFDAMARGEIVQRGRRFDLDQDEEDYIHTIEAKTASLLAAACAAAVIVSAGGEREVREARAYGRGVGIAFQVVDDVLDYTASEAELGKPVGGDIAEGTVTLPLILTLRDSTAPVRAMLASARERGDFSAVVQAVRRSGSTERCLELAARHSAEAIEALQGFPDVPERRSLAEVAEGLASRRG